MVRFTLRDWMWLKIAAGLISALPCVADAQAQNFKRGDRVYVKHMHHEGYGTVRASDARGYIVELDRTLGGTYQIPREHVYGSQREAVASQTKKADGPPIRDLAPLYQAIGAGMGGCCMTVVFLAALVYVVRRRLKPRTDLAVDAEIVP